MPGMAIVILVLAGGLALGVKGRAAGVAAWCSGLLVLFVCATPVGAGLPGAVSAVFSVIDGAASPVLAGEGPAEDGERGPAGGRPISREQAYDDGEDDGSGARVVRQVGVDR